MTLRNAEDPDGARTTAYCLAFATSVLFFHFRVTNILPVGPYIFKHEYLFIYFFDIYCFIYIRFQLNHLNEDAVQIPGQIRNHRLDDMKSGSKMGRRKNVTHPFSQGVSRKGWVASLRRPTFLRSNV